MSSPPDARAAFRLVVVTAGDAHLRFDEALALPALAFSGGATALWIRERALDDERLFALARAARTAADRSGGVVWISGRVDIARRAGLDAVQLGFRDVRPDAVSAADRMGLSVGYSAHDPLEEISIQAADHVTLAPLFATDPSLAKSPPLGVERFATLRARIARPVVALGGIDRTNAALAMRAGADGVAVLRAVARAADPSAAAAELRAIVDAALG